MVSALVEILVDIIFMILAQTKGFWLIVAAIALAIAVAVVITSFIS